MQGMGHRFGAILRYAVMTVGMHPDSVPHVPHRSCGSPWNEHLPQTHLAAIV